MRNTIQPSLIAILLMWAYVPAAEPIPVEYLWQSEPKLNVVWEVAPDVPNIHINAKQAGSSYAIERMRAAQAILRVPNSPTLNRQELLDATLARLQAGEDDPTVRAELVAAACELDDGQHIDLFWKLGQGDRIIQPVVETACIGWRKSEPLGLWRERLKEQHASPTHLLLAIDGLAAVGTPEDVPALKAIVLDETRVEPVRLAAARAIGTLARDSQLELATQLKKSGARYPELLAVEVLGNSPVESATAFIQEIANKSTPTAERAAYEWLCNRHPEVAQTSSKARLQHHDAKIRSLAVDQIATLNDQDTLPALIAALDDVHPANREQARLKILIHSDRSPAHLEAVYQQLSAILTSQSWRPVEQAIRLAVELKRPEHVPQLISLLEHDRSEVCITAAWALRHLATDQPSLDAMFEHLTIWVNRLTDFIEKLKKSPPDPSLQPFRERDLRRMAHLFEAMGLRLYQPAKPMLVQFVPKDPNRGLITRMTAIWACGRLWENSTNKELTGELEVRIADKNSMFPESGSVRFACTLALGYIADPETRQSIVRCNEAPPGPISQATEWALGRIDAREKK